MSKKDYIKLAQALKDSKPQGFPQMTEDYKNFFAGKETAWNNTVETIAMTLQHDNPRFNRSRFLRACGYTDDDEWEIRAEMTVNSNEYESSK